MCTLYEELRVFLCASMNGESLGYLVCHGLVTVVTIVTLITVVIWKSLANQTAMKSLPPFSKVKCQILDDTIRICYKNALYVISYIGTNFNFLSIDPSGGATAQIGPWRPLIFCPHNVLSLAATFQLRLVNNGTNSSYTLSFHT
jgi:hypothetical protein